MVWRIRTNLKYFYLSYRKFLGLLSRSQVGCLVVNIPSSTRNEERGQFLPVMKAAPIYVSIYLYTLYKENFIFKNIYRRVKPTSRNIESWQMIKFQDCCHIDSLWWREGCSVQCSVGLFVWMFYHERALEIKTKLS